MSVTTFTGWAIDRDHIDVGRVGTGQRDAEQVRDDAARIIGRRVTIEDNLSAACVEDPVRFRVLDDDGEVYYGGAISRSWLDGDEELAFAPLIFATADAGATDMQYRDKNGEWRLL